MTTGRPWTLEGEAEVRRRYPTDEPVEDIAESMDRTVPAIKRCACRLGVKRKWWSKDRPFQRKYTPPPKQVPKVKISPWPKGIQFEDDPAALAEPKAASTGW